MTLRLAGPLLLVGVGKMGGALLEGWLRQGLDPAQIFISDPAPSADVAALLARHRIDASRLPPRPSTIVIAVKPQIVDETLKALAVLVGKSTVVLSIAAGRTLASLAKHLPKRAAIVRAMPNIAAAVGRSMTVACANAAVAREQALECTELLETVGEVMWIKNEGLMDAVTAVSGSGPAYVFLLAECLAEAGRKAGTRRRGCRPIGASGGRRRRRTAPKLRPHAGGAPREGNLAQGHDRRRARGADGEGRLRAAANQRRRRRRQALARAIVLIPPIRRPPCTCLFAMPSGLSRLRLMKRNSSCRPGSSFRRLDLA